jgi:hypothetical protein
MLLAYPKLKNSAPLQQIMRRPDLWKGRNGPVVRSSSVSTGYKRLDERLLHKGWPLKGLIEFQQQAFGNGEWHLLLPALRALLQEEPGYLALIKPPAIPYSPALAQQGIDLTRVLVIDPPQKKDWLVSVREVLAANCCVALFCWEPEQRLLYPELRKMQLAVSQSSTLCFLLRSASGSSYRTRSNPTPNQTRARAYSASPAVLRLALQNQETGLEVQIDKQRGSYQRGKVLLPWSSYVLQQSFTDSKASLEERANNILLFNRSA